MGRRWGPGLRGMRTISKDFASSSVLSSLSWLSSWGGVFASRAPKVKCARRWPPISHVSAGAWSVYAKLRGPLGLAEGIVGEDGDVDNGDAQRRVCLIFRVAGIGVPRVAVTCEEEVDGDVERKFRLHVCTTETVGTSTEIVMSRGGSSASEVDDDDDDDQVGDSREIW